MNATRIAAAMLLLGVVGCGGGGSKEKFLACGNSTGCLTMESEKAVDMTCTAPEVDACSDEGVLGVCVWKVDTVTYTLRIYLEDALDEAEDQCDENDGTWTDPSAPQT